MKKKKRTESILYIYISFKTCSKSSKYRNGNRKFLEPNPAFDLASFTARLSFIVTWRDPLGRLTWSKQPRVMSCHPASVLQFWKTREFEPENGFSQEIQRSDCSVQQEASYPKAVLFSTCFLMEHSSQYSRNTHTLLSQVLAAPA